MSRVGLWANKKEDLNGKGTVIMFYPSIDVETIECTTSEKGRIIILEARFDDTKFISVNIYASKGLDKREMFGDQISSNIVW